MNDVRVLPDDLFLKILVLLVVLVALLVMNIYLYVRRKKSNLLTAIHVNSFFVFMFFFFTLIQSTIIQLDFGIYFKRAAGVSGAISLVLLLNTLIIYLSVKNQAKQRFDLSPDLYNVFKSNDDLSIICDAKMNIVDMSHANDSMLFGYPCQRLEDLKAILLDLSHPRQNAVITDFLACIHKPSVIEIEFENRGEHYFLISSPILKSRTRVVGYSLLFHDISEEKRLIKEIENYNDNLNIANIKLKDYVNVAEKLEAEKERKRLLDEIQHDLINRIEEIIVMLDEVNYEEVTDAKEVLTTLTKKMREVYKTIRCSVATIKNRKGSCEND